MAIDTEAVQNLAGTLSDFGIYGFAAAALVCLVVAKAMVLKVLFGFVFLLGAALSVAKIWFPPPESVRYVFGDFGLFTSNSAPRVLTTGHNFYTASLRKGDDEIGVEWVLFLQDPMSRLTRDHVEFALYQPFEKKTIDNNLKEKVEKAMRGGHFKLPTKPFLDRSFKMSQLVELKVEGHNEFEDALCLKGALFKDAICNSRLTRTTSSELPASSSRTMFGSLLDRLIPSALAQNAGQGMIDPILLSRLLMSDDLSQLKEAAKAIQKGPERYAAVINDFLRKPIGENTYGGRSAIITALREKYLEQKTIYPDSATFAWLDDSSWRRIILDSFDRSDVLGEMSRRLLRTAKSPQVRGVLNGTVPEVIGKLPKLDTCLNLLEQDIYVNWSVLSLNWLKEAKKVTTDNTKHLLDLLTEIQFPANGSLAQAYRLRANYIKAVILLETAWALDLPSGNALDVEAIAALKQIVAAVDRLGVEKVQNAYHGNNTEIDKARTVLRVMAEAQKIDIEILRKAEGVAKSYPSCKI
jgi:hypothetical protein